VIDITVKCRNCGELIKLYGEVLLGDNADTSMRVLNVSCVCGASFRVTMYQ
jgi:hypothetical protein